MSEQDGVERKKGKSSRKMVLIAVVVALGVGVVCFVVVALLPRPEGPFFKAPLRSVLTGLGVVGIACPFCIAGSIVKKRWAASPYFEGAFIATALNIFGYLLLGVGLLCVGAGIYALVARLLGSG
ncbi:MAG: hypothetical protein JSU70_10125 [Phycisphaerales bacterium]|nr:MAG: hypothetical protein JSU70_10125 [Phycisphaerales bacterium]